MAPAGKSPRVTVLAAVLLVAVLLPLWCETTTGVLIQVASDVLREDTTIALKPVVLRIMTAPVMPRSVSVITKVSLPVRVTSFTRGASVPISIPSETTRKINTDARKDQ